MPGLHQAAVGHDGAEQAVCWTSAQQPSITGRGAWQPQQRQGCWFPAPAAEGPGSDSSSSRGVAKGLQGLLHYAAATEGACRVCADGHPVAGTGQYCKCAHCQSSCGRGRAGCCIFCTATAVAAAGVGRDCSAWCRVGGGEAGGLGDMASRLMGTV